MARYEGKEMERIPPTLGVGVRELILVTHDECVFYSNDGFLHFVSVRERVRGACYCGVQPVAWNHPPVAG